MKKLKYYNLVEWSTVCILRSIVFLFFFFDNHPATYQVDFGIMSERCVDFYV